MTLLKILKSPLRRRGGEGVQEIAEKIRCLRRDVFVDDPYISMMMSKKSLTFLSTG